MCKPVSNREWKEGIQLFFSERGCVLTLDRQMQSTVAALTRGRGWRESGLHEVRKRDAGGPRPNAPAGGD